MNLQVRSYRVENFSKQGFIFGFSLGMNPTYYFGFKNSNKELLFIFDRESNSLLLKSDSLSPDLFKNTHEIWSIPEEDEYIEVLHTMFDKTLVQNIQHTFNSHKNSMTFLNKDKQTVTFAVSKLDTKKSKKSVPKYNIDNDCFLI